MDGDLDGSLGRAMAQSALQDGIDKAKAENRKQDRRIEDLEQRMRDLELANSTLLDACRFLYRYYVNGTSNGKWPLKDE